MNKNNNFLWKFAGMATQFLVAIAFAVFGGMEVDKWLNIGMPLAVWLLPLFIITGLIIKIIKETSTKK